MSADIAVADEGDRPIEDEIKTTRSWQLGPVVTGLRQSRDITHNIWQRGPNRRAPSRKAMSEVVKGLTEALFPRHYAPANADITDIDSFVADTLQAGLDGLLDQIHRGLTFVADGPPTDRHRDEAVALTEAFATKLPEMRGALVGDLRAAFVGDPAATSFPEILIGYPGMTAVIHHRIAHLLHKLGAPLVARLIAELAHVRRASTFIPVRSSAPACSSITVRVW